MKRRSFLLLASLLATWNLQAAPIKLAPFKSGHTIGFLGDSITARGTLQTYLANFYHTRYPELDLKFINAGRSGDSASGALGRVEEDLLQHQPNVVFLMMGMNDVGRGNYVANPSPKQKEAQAASLQRYRENMEKLVQQVLASPSKPQIVFITPTPFDETLQQELHNNQPGCNEGLAKCAAFVRELAQKYQAPVLDYHAKLTAFNLDQQKKDPSFTIVGPDRVHMGNEGYLMCAWILLKEQGISPIVSLAEIQVSNGGAKVGKQENTLLSDFHADSEKVQFTALSKALPYPMPPDTDRLQSLLPIGPDLNQEILRVVGLALGNYELLIDGVSILKASHDELAKGINLADFSNSPAYQQALKVAALNGERRAAESECLVLLNARRRIEQHHRVNPDDKAAVQALYDRSDNKTDYHIAMTKRYLERWHLYSDLKKTVAEKDQAANEAKQPMSHRFILRKLP